MSIVADRKNIFHRLLRIVLKTGAIIIVLLIIVIFLIQTSFVQNIIRSKAEAYLQKKLHTRIEIGRFYLSYSGKIILKNIYIGDQRNDTLFSGKLISADISFLKLLHQELEVKQLRLEDITGKVKRTLPDTTFNFQFIVNAFASAGTKTQQDTVAAKPWKVNFDALSLEKIRLLYTDVVTGYNVDIFLAQLETGVKITDPGYSQFDIASLKIAGLRGRIYQRQSLQVPPPAPATAKENANVSRAFRLRVGDVSLDSIDIDYRDFVGETYAQINLIKSRLLKGDVDLQHSRIVMHRVEMDNSSIQVKMGKKKVMVQSVKADSMAAAPNTWYIKTDDIALDNNTIRYDDDNAAPQPAGMDYAHLRLSDFTLQLTDFLYHADSIQGMISKAAMKEKSGFVLNQFHTRFLYAAHEAYLQDLLLQTPGTTIRRSLVVHYPSIPEIQQHTERLQFDVDMQQSKIQVKDILIFVPSLRKQPLFSNPDNTWLLDGAVSGNLANMHLSNLHLQGLSATSVAVNGDIAGLPAVRSLSGNISIKVVSSRKDIALLASGKLPANIILPETIGLAGTISAGKNILQTLMQLNSSSGNATLKAAINGLTDMKHAGYTASITTDRIDIGAITSNTKNIGTISAYLTVQGRGIDAKTADASATGIIKSLNFKQYEYRNLAFNAHIKDQQVQARAGSDDPNIHFQLRASADITTAYPAIKMEATIDSIKTQALHLTQDKIVYHGKINADFPSTDPDQLKGDLWVTQSLLLKDDQRIQMDSISLSAGASDRGRFITLATDMLNFQLKGQYKLTQLGSVFQQLIQPYYTIIPEGKMVTNDPYRFSLSATLIDKPVLRTLLPGLERLDPVAFHGHFSNGAGWDAMLDAPLVAYAGYHINKLHLQAAVKDSAINIQTSIAQLKSSSISLFKTALDAGIKNNEISFDLLTKDSILKDKYHIAGLFRQPQQGQYVFSLHPGNLLLNAKNWKISKNNQVIISPDDLVVHDFLLENQGQQLSINSTAASPHAPVAIRFTDFRIAAITAFAQQDSSLADGILQGNIVLSGLLKNPVFTSDLLVHDFSMHRDTIGNIAIKVKNTDANTLLADIGISGHGNTLGLKGSYYLKPSGSNSFDMLLDIGELQMKTLQAAAPGVIKRASGSVAGKFAVAGNISQPVINGELNFNKASVVPAMLNSYFSIDKQQLKINKDGIRFDAFSISDSLQNKLVLDGDVKTTDFLHYNFDLTVKARNFQALNSTQQDNKLYYGQLYFNSNLRIKGTELQPTVDGNIKIDDKTKLTVVMPQQDPGIEDRKGVVQFVNRRLPGQDSLFKNQEDSVNTSSIVGMDISANISVDKNAEFNLVIDPGNGDNLKVKGEATLTGGIDKSGKVTLSGNYALDQGSYDLSFSLLHRKFNISKGSTITWTGEPTKANVDISAVYIANTAPLDLVQDQLDQSSATVRNTYLQKLPFQVNLKMQGELLKPAISFDVVLPDDRSYNVSKDIVSSVETKLDQLRQDPSEMNRQVIALLLLNRFVSDDPFAGSSGGTSAESIARQSASKILTEQLNKLAGSLIKGVDINFDLQSTDDYTTGQLQNRTDLNVALSKKLLNDRLAVTVGSNFELEGPQQASDQSNNLAGNIAVDYKLSKDGRYMLRAYRKNDYDEVLEGYVVETGVSFILTIDYNRFREIFQQKKKRDRSDKKKDNKVVHK